MGNKKIIFQTSKRKLKEINKSILKHASDWEYIHFDDSEIIDFFKNNPIEGLEDIEKRFHEILLGPHKSDLFRYYFLYLNGGFFIDADIELSHDLTSVVKDYDFVTAYADAEEPGIVNVTNRSRAFNGYLYVSDKHNEIIKNCLFHLYNLSQADLGPSNGFRDDRYSLVCEFLYNAICAYPDKSNIKLYKITATKRSFITDNDLVLAEHRYDDKPEEIV